MLNFNNEINSTNITNFYDKTCYTDTADTDNTTELSNSNSYIKIIGTIQDGGYPSLGCQKKCCKDEELWKTPKYFVSSIGLVIKTKNTNKDKDKVKDINKDSNNEDIDIAPKIYLFDVSPDIKPQFYNLQKENPSCKYPTGVFLTHAHVGHYLGLPYFGREALNTKNVELYAYNRMIKFLQNNGPFSQLFKLSNIIVKQDLSQNNIVKLEHGIEVESFLVNHRDEYSETCGFIIKSKTTIVLFIPDIDNFTEIDIISLIKKSTYAFIDGTFYNEHELPGRNIKEIPHPLIFDSIQFFKSKLSLEECGKIYFTHLNHTNPCLDINSEAYNYVKKNGFNIVNENMRIDLN